MNHVKSILKFYRLASHLKNSYNLDFNPNGNSRNHFIAPEISKEIICSVVCLVGLVPGISSSEISKNQTAQNWTKIEKRFNETYIKILFKRYWNISRTFLFTFKSFNFSSFVIVKCQTCIRTKHNNCFMNRQCE